MQTTARQILKKHFGYDHFRQAQEEIIESIVNGTDTFAIMPTGAGKSLCYQVPSLMLEGVTLVISPLISLMKDQVDSLQLMGIPATYINSSLTTAQVYERIKQIKKGDSRLLYIAPERLESPEFLEQIRGISISLLAIDESHCVSQWGHDFRPSYRSIPAFIKQLDKRPIIAAFTATATEEVKNDVVSLLQLSKPNVYVTGFDRKNLFFSVIRGENRRDYIINYVRSHPNHVGVIYAATRKEVESIYKDLCKAGCNPAKYHAGMDVEDRQQYQDGFLFDDYPIIVATNAFGMGIDKSNVRYVIHHNLPKNMEAYYQEAGRAGRDGEASECILLFAPQDIVLQKFMIEQSTSDAERKRFEYNRLKEMVDYCYTPNCLRKYILEYFGERDLPETCGNCSTCCDESEQAEITEAAQKIFSCIIRMKERFGVTLIVQALRGSKNQKMQQFGFQRLPTYGIMKEYSEKELKDMINILVADGYLTLSDGQFPVPKITEKAIGVLKDGQPVYQKTQKKHEARTDDNPLLELLKQLRKDISRQENVPPYMIFPDGTLREMSQKYPIDRQSLLRIKGVGESKLHKYGHAFLNIIRQYVEEHHINATPAYRADTPIDAHTETKAATTDKKPSFMTSFELYSAGRTIKEIAKERQLTLLTVENHIIQAANSGLPVNLDDFIPADYEQQIRKAIETIGSEKLRLIKDALPASIDYLAIRAVICKHRL